MKVTLIGTGGAGTNHLNRIVESYEYELDAIVIDTSKSNSIHKDVSESFVVGNGIGSGRNRQHNAEALIHKVPKLTTLDSDVVIILSSTSGGSGNVIANLLAATLLKAGKHVIMVLTSHVNTLRSAENTQKALQSLAGICGEKYQIPTMLYDNKPGRAEVDKNINEDLTILLDLLTGTWSELDDTDKLKFLSPDVIGPNSLGVYPETAFGPLDDLTFGENQLYVPEHAIVPSVITVNETGDALDNISAIEDFVGISNEFHMFGLSGLPLSAIYLKYVGETIEEFRRANVKTTNINILETATESIADDIVI